MDTPKHKRCECEWKQKDGQTYYSGCGDYFWQPDGEDPIKTTMGVCPFCCEKIVMIDESKYGVCLNQNIINIQLVIEKTLLNSKIDFVSQAPN